MQLKCIAIDDEPLALELLKEYISRFPQLKLVHTFDDAISAVELLRNTRVDLLFIDINMPDITGIDLVRSLQEKPLIIFTTAHKQFAIEGFELDAVDYLLKPINIDRFTRAVHKAIDYYKYKNTPALEDNDCLFVHSEYKLVKIQLSEIEYIESLEDYIKIHIAGAKPVLTLMSMKKVLEKLPADKFQRIHRSYIVSVAKVKSIQNRKVQLSGGVELPISDSYVNFINSWKKN
ncbi:DNA-binding response regulator [Niastella vici]|uniref:DNA-binding response regulator n=1 Tax=Niastella vici TaxID=1703345 RepID=A0A1V9G9X2_9BACT|nr:LytTR family DNA-binding domain-containing protein [Niastella vici]OQP67423.1 DNA-binding response regulator [Niastella vici]